MYRSYTGMNHVPKRNLVGTLQQYKPVVDQNYKLVCAGYIVGAVLLSSPTTWAVVISCFPSV